MRKIVLLAMALFALTAIGVGNTGVADAGFIDALKDVTGQEVKPKT